MQRDMDMECIYVGTLILRSMLCNYIYIYIYTHIVVLCYYAMDSGLNQWSQQTTDNWMTECRNEGR